MTATPSSTPGLAVPALPLVVQVGFAGARRFFGGEDEAGRHDDRVREQLIQHLRTLRAALGLTDQHFLAGISQLAAGADMLFTESLAELGWPQRLFLPQVRDEFLAAQGSQGPDFSAAERERASRLFASDHVIEETVVSIAADRTARFEDANLQIVGDADVFVCLRPEGAPSRVGGTGQMIERARSRGKPVLELVLSQDANHQPLLRPVWHGLDLFKPPSLPAALQSLTPALMLTASGGVPSSTEYASRLKDHGSLRAAERRKAFTWAAAIIIGTHVVATLLAALAFKASDMRLNVIVGIELLFIFYGLFTHFRLHHSKAVPDWAVTRLCAEVGRSVRAFAGIPFALRHLHRLAFPPDLRPMLRTMNVLHLRSLRSQADLDWKALQAVYLKDRLRDLVSGQVVYYAKQCAQAQRQLRLANRMFICFSSLAIVAVIAKVGLKYLELPAAIDLATEVLGVLGVWLPVLAVGAMSLAAAMDLEARSHTFEEMHDFLQSQANHVSAATSVRELSVLAAETETRLLGETLNWFVRRAHTSVA